MYSLRDVNDNYLDFLGNPFVIAWKLDCWLSVCQMWNYLDFLVNPFVIAWKIGGFDWLSVSRLIGTKTRPSQLKIVLGWSCFKLPTFPTLCYFWLWPPTSGCGLQLPVSASNFLFSSSNFLWMIITWMSWVIRSLLLWKCWFYWLSVPRDWIFRASMELQIWSIFACGILDSFSLMKCLRLLGFLAKSVRLVLWSSTSGLFGLQLPVLASNFRFSASNFLFRPPTSFEW
jgi:hypothetical protein